MERGRPATWMVRPGIGGPSETFLGSDNSSCTRCGRWKRAQESVTDRVLTIPPSSCCLMSSGLAIERGPDMRQEGVGDDPDKDSRHTWIVLGRARGEHNRLRHRGRPRTGGKTMARCRKPIAATSAAPQRRPGRVDRTPAETATAGRAADDHAPVAGRSRCDRRRPRPPAPGPPPRGGRVNRGGRGRAAPPTSAAAAR